jgi:hypothetical protein
MKEFVGGKLEAILICTIGVAMHIGRSQKTVKLDGVI